MNKTIKDCFENSISLVVTFKKDKSKILFNNKNDKWKTDSDIGINKIYTIILENNDISFIGAVH